MFGKIIMAITAILLSINIISIMINLWLRRRKYAIVPRCGFDDTEKYINWEDIDDDGT